MWGVAHYFQEHADEDIDWWSKFYASVGDNDKAGIYLDKGYDKLMVKKRARFPLITTYYKDN